jgi:hypothetical protein
MTPAAIKQSLESGKLALSGWEWFTHFEPAFALAFIASLMPAFSVYDLLTVGEIVLPDSVPKVFFVATVIPATAAVLLYTYRQRELILTRIDTDRSRQEITTAIVELAGKNDWEVRNKTKRYMVLRTHPRFWSGSWGERMTVLFEKDKVWVNSICDPEKQASVVSMGRNRQNVAALIVTIRSIPTNVESV